MSLQESPQWVSYVFLAIVILLTAAAILAILWAMHHVRFSRARVRRRRRRVTRKSHFFSELQRRKSESGGAYLRRLHGVLSAQHAASTLDVLASQLDALFYGGIPVRLSREEYTAYAAQIRHLHRPPKAGRSRSA